MQLVHYWPLVHRVKQHTGSAKKHSTEFLCRIPQSWLILVISSGAGVAAFGERCWACCSKRTTGSGWTTAGNGDAQLTTVSPGTSCSEFLVMSNIAIIVWGVSTLMLWLCERKGIRLVISTDTTVPWSLLSATNLTWSSSENGSVKQKPSVCVCVCVCVFHASSSVGFVSFCRYWLQFSCMRAC